MSIVNVVSGKITVNGRRLSALVVGRTGINEEDGVFALVLSKQRYTPKRAPQIMATFYSGDDGSWRELCMLDFHYIIQIAQLLLIAIDLQDSLLQEK